MQNYIPVEELQTRRGKMFHLMPDNSVVIIHSGSIIHRNNDTEYPFRQNSNFWYMSGIDEPDCAIIFIKYAGVFEQLLFIPQNDKLKTAFSGKSISISDTKQASGIDTVYYNSELLEKLLKPIKSAENIFFDETDAGSSILNQRVLKFIAEYKKPELNIQKPYQILKKLRIEKSGWELDQLRQAAQINTLAFSKIQDIFNDRARQVFTNSQPFFSDIAKPKLWEYQIEAELLNVYKQNGLDWSYPPIVAAGKNATVLHYSKNNSEILDTDMILIDAGCEYNYYASDITRTITTSEAITFAQREIYDLVLKTHNSIINKLTSTLGNQKQKIVLEGGAGVVEIRNQNDITLQELQRMSVESLSQGLIDLNILSGTLEEVIETKSYSKYYMHSISHWMGLDVHDIGGYKDDNDLPISLKQGYVFTVEPGLYFPADDQSIPPELRGLGVRIEDDIAITETGIEILSDGVDR